MNDNPGRDVAAVEGLSALAELVTRGHQPLPRAVVEAMAEVDRQMSMTGHATYTANGVEAHLCLRGDSCDYTPPDGTPV